MRSRKKALRKELSTSSAAPAQSDAVHAAEPDRLGHPTHRRDPLVAGLFDEQLLGVALHQIDRPELQARALDELEERHGWWEATRRLLAVGPRGVKLALERWGDWIDRAGVSVVTAGIPALVPDGVSGQASGTPPGDRRPVPPLLPQTPGDQPLLRQGLGPGELRPTRRRPAVADLYPDGMLGRGGAAPRDAQRRARPGAGESPVIPERALETLGEGRPLEREHQARMERLLGTGLEDVRIHDDAAAEPLTDALEAEAFTVGRHIVFAPGRYRPQTEEGAALLAHELTHVVQQGRGEAPLQRGESASGPTAGASEQAAEAMADRARLQHRAEAASPPDLQPAPPPAAATRPASLAQRMHGQTPAEPPPNATDAAPLEPPVPHRLELDSRPTDLQRRPKQNATTLLWLDLLHRSHWAIPKTDPADREDKLKGVKPEDIDLKDLFEGEDPLAAIRQGLAQLNLAPPGKPKPSRPGGTGGAPTGDVRPGEGYRGLQFQPLPPVPTPAREDEKGGGDLLEGLPDKEPGESAPKNPRLQREHAQFQATARLMRGALKQTAQQVDQGLKLQAREASTGVQLEAREAQKGIAADVSKARKDVQDQANATRKQLEASFKAQLAALTRENNAQRDRALTVARTQQQDIGRLYQEKARDARRLGQEQINALNRHAQTQASLARAAGAAAAGEYRSHERAAEIRQAVTTLASDGANRILETARATSEALKKDSEALARKLEQEGREQVAALARAEREVRQHFASLLSRGRSELQKAHQDSLQAVKQAQEQSQKAVRDMEQQARASVQSHAQEQLRALRIAEREAVRAFQKAFQGAFRALDTQVDRIQDYVLKMPAGQWRQTAAELKRATGELQSQVGEVRQQLLQGMTMLRGRFLQQGQEIVRGLMLARQKIGIKLSGAATEIHKALDQISQAHTERLRHQVQGLSAGWGKEADEKIQGFNKTTQEARKAIVDLYDQGVRQLREKHDGAVQEINGQLGQIRKDVRAKAQEIANQGGFLSGLLGFMKGLVKGLWTSLSGFLKALLIVALIVLVIVVVVALVIVLFWGVGALGAAAAAVASFAAAVSGIVALAAKVLTILTVVTAGIKMIRAFTEDGLSPEKRGEKFGESLGDLVTEFGPGALLKRFKLLQMHRAFNAARRSGYGGNLSRFSSLWQRGRRFDLASRRWVKVPDAIPMGAARDISAAFSQARASGYRQSFEHFADLWRQGKRFSLTTRRWTKAADVAGETPPGLQRLLDTFKRGYNNYDPRKAPAWLKEYQQRAKLELAQEKTIPHHLIVAHDLHKGFATSLYQAITGIEGDWGVADNSLYLWRLLNRDAPPGKAPAR